MKNFKKTSLILILFLGVTSILCVASFALMCIFGINPNIHISRQQNNAENDATLAKTYDFGEGYIKNIVFTGDKTLAQLTLKCPEISPSQVWCGEDGTLRLDHNLSGIPIVHSDGKRFPSIAEASESYRPMYMLITVGLDNGVGYCTEEKFKEYYLDLINSVKESSPDTMIILQSVLPVSRTAEKKDPSISNNRIRQANGWICGLAGEASVRYLDTNTALCDAKGYLNSEYDSGDGITLNEAGYQKMLEYIRTHGYK